MPRLKVVNIGLPIVLSQFPRTYLSSGIPLTSKEYKVKCRQAMYLSLNMHGVSFTSGIQGGIVVAIQLFQRTSSPNRLQQAIETVVKRLIDEQNVDGSWSDCFDTGMMPNAQTVISLRLLGWEDPTWTEPLLDQILVSQRPDGSWGLYPGDEGDLSTTIECYYALQLYGKWSTAPHRQFKAKQWILSHGGLKQCRNLTKVFLAIGGEIPWSWLPSPWVHLLMFARRSLISIFDVVTFTRLHIAPMILLSALRYAATADERVLGDLVDTPLQWRSNNRHVPFNSGIPLRWLFRCLNFMLNEREKDGTAGGYHSSTFLVIFALTAFGYDIEHPEIQSAILAMRANFYVNGQSGVCHQQTCNAHVWNTALAVHGLIQAGVDPQSPSLQRSKLYLLSKQHKGGGHKTQKNLFTTSGWGFSSNNTKHPDCDDTVVCLDVLSRYRQVHADEWRRGVDWLLHMQNQDGGWSAFDKDCKRHWMEWLPANDMRRAMCDPSTPDITGRVVEFLLRHKVLPPDHPRIQRSIHWLKNHQEKDGSWFGRWGTTYLYGTWCAVKALSVAHTSIQDKTLMGAQEWLLKVQHDDGGFGESCQSDLSGRYTTLPVSQPSQTAWGLDALLSLYELDPHSANRTRVRRAVQSAANWLLENRQEGGWTEKVPTGSAFPGALHIRYEIYPKVWPLVALSNYQRVMGRDAETASDRERG